LTNFFIVESFRCISCKFCCDFS